MALEGFLSCPLSGHSPSILPVPVSAGQPNPREIQALGKEAGDKGRPDT